MKRLMLVAVAGTALAAASFAALGDVVASFRGPHTSLHGVARSNDYLYVLTLE